VGLEREEDAAAADAAALATFEISAAMEFEERAVAVEFWT
jgi:hypothetical protein